MNTAQDVGGALGRAALMEFDNIGGMNGITTPLVTTLEVSTFRPLVYRLPVRRLVLQLSERKLWSFTPKGMFRDFREVELLADLLRGCGADLRELVLDTSAIEVTEKEILAIATHCKKIEELCATGATGD